MTGRLPRWPLAVVAVLLLATAWAALAQEGTDSRARYQDREAELERIRGEIARLQASLSRVQARERSLESVYEQTGLELRLQEQRVAEARAARELSEARVAVAEARVGELEAELGRVRGDLHDRLVTLYRLGRAGYVRLMLSIDQGADVLEAMRQIRFLARRDSALLDRYVDAKARLGIEREDLVQEQARVVAWLRQEEVRRGRLAELEDQQSRQLASIRRERRSLETESSELVAKERKLANFLSLLYGRSTDTVAGAPMQDFRGVLEWPVRGRVTEAFGPRRDPRYSTLVPHNGLELSTPAGQPVRAIYAGEVLFAAPFRGYGPTVIVHHPRRVFSLYAGLAETRVAVGDVLSLGQVVGSSAESLYFEIRVENRPQDPMLWLRK